MLSGNIGAVGCQIQKGAGMEPDNRGVVTCGNGSLEVRARYAVLVDAVFGSGSGTGNVNCSKVHSYGGICGWSGVGGTWLVSGMAQQRFASLYQSYAFGSVLYFAACTATGTAANTDTVSALFVCRVHDTELWNEGVGTE